MQETREIRVQSLGWEGPLEKEMATHSVFLPEKSHGESSLVGYSPWGHKRVRHLATDCFAISAAAAAAAAAACNL